ncbi:hypothetical protein [Roseovarius pacificus]|uniref:hypothetical protein n=1 Tax=Roseovarius pacificus TaxID=337701 RepID=UPI0009333087|nr:hypothetical protein [Roseovarius pacificus]
MVDAFKAILVILMIISMIWLVYQLFVIVGEMSLRRGHNPWPWWLLSLAWSPFAVMFILWVFFPAERDATENK